MLKSARRVGRIGKILLGAIGFGSLFYSCSKSKDCKCTNSEKTYLNGETVYEYQYTYFILDTLVDKCRELDYSSSYSYGTSVTVEESRTCK